MCVNSPPLGREQSSVACWATLFWAGGILHSNNRKKEQNQHFVGNVDNAIGMR
jgi:hypothetical protein